MSPNGKWVLLVGFQLRERVVDMAVASFVSTHRQKQIPHGCILTKLPVVGGDIRYLQTSQRHTYKLSFIVISIANHNQHPDNCANQDVD